MRIYEYHPGETRFNIRNYRKKCKSEALQGFVQKQPSTVGATMGETDFMPAVMFE